MIKLLMGDCCDVLAGVADDSIDMVFTSPPYADRRIKVYGGVSSHRYVDWFIPISKQIKRVLKPSGSFFLNIKPHVCNGERDLYVFDLVLALKRQVGFMFVDEYCWVKNAYPGRFHGRFKNAFEPVYHFTKGDIAHIVFNPLACGTPIKEVSIVRAGRKQCGSPKNGSGMTAINNGYIDRNEVARPSNVIAVNNVSNQYSPKQLHPATFPEGLVEFFVKSFSDKGGVVLDPFMGIGTTGIVCKRNARHFVGVEIVSDYYHSACNILQEKE